MRTVDRQDIDPRHHLVEAFPIGRAKRLFDLGAQLAAVVVMHLHAKGPRAAFRRADPLGYSMISGEPLFVFANIEKFTATEA